MSSFLKIASSVLLPLTLAGCLAEQADDGAADPGASERLGESAQAQADSTPGSSPASTASTACSPPPTIAGPSGAPLPGPYACAALANGTTPTTSFYPGYYPTGYYPGLGYGSGYYPGLGYGSGYYPGLGYGSGYYPSSFGLSSGYYPGLGYPPGYYPGSGLAAPGPQTSDPNSACACPTP